MTDTNNNLVEEARRLAPTEMEGVASDRILIVRIPDVPDDVSDEAKESDAYKALSGDAEAQARMEQR